MDRGAWQATVSPRGRKESDSTERLHLHFHWEEGAWEAGISLGPCRLRTVLPVRLRAGLRAADVAFSCVTSIHWGQEPGHDTVTGLFFQWGEGCHCGI